VLAIASAVRWVPAGKGAIAAECGTEKPDGARDNVFTRDGSLDRSLDAWCRFSDGGPR
jgi:hypothetical protein